MVHPALRGCVKRRLSRGARLGQRQTTTLQGTFYMRIYDILVCVAHTPSHLKNLCLAFSFPFLSSFISSFFWGGPVRPVHRHHSHLILTSHSCPNHITSSARSFATTFARERKSASWNAWRRIASCFPHPPTSDARSPGLAIPRLFPDAAIEVIRMGRAEKAPSVRVVLRALRCLPAR